MTPASRLGGYKRCASTADEGVIAGVDQESRTLTIKTNKGETKKLKAIDQTRFLVPGAPKEDLRTRPLATLVVDARARVSYCTKDEALVEVRVLK